MTIKKNSIQNYKKFSKCGLWRVWVPNLPTLRHNFNVLNHLSIRYIIRLCRNVSLSYSIPSPVLPCYFSWCGRWGRRRSVVSNYISFRCLISVMSTINSQHIEIRRTGILLRLCRCSIHIRFVLPILPKSQDSPSSSFPHVRGYGQFLISIAGSDCECPTYLVLPELNIQPHEDDISVRGCWFIPLIECAPRIRMNSLAFSCSHHLSMLSIYLPNGHGQTRDYHVSRPDEYWIPLEAQQQQQQYQKRRRRRRRITGQNTDFS